MAILTKLDTEMVMESTPPPAPLPVDRLYVVWTLQPYATPLALQPYALARYFFFTHTPFVVVVDDNFTHITLQLRSARRGTLNGCTMYCPLLIYRYCGRTDYSCLVQL